MEPKTAFAIWLRDALKKQGKSLKLLSRELELDYTGLWRIAQGDPERYPNNLRPEYANALRIGQLLGDVTGALKAADYPEALDAPAKEEDAAQRRVLLPNGITMDIPAGVKVPSESDRRKISAILDTFLEDNGK